MSSEKVIPFWRSWDWQRWRQHYIKRTPETERRAWIRHRSHHNADCRSEDNGDLLPAQIQNISMGGMSLQVGQEFNAGAVLQVLVPTTLEETPRLFWVRVLYVRPEGEGQWTMGGVFTQPIREDHVQAVRADWPRPPGVEQRAAVRYPCDVPATCRVAFANGKETWPAQVRDLSVIGLGMRVSFPFRPGTGLLVELPARNGRGPFTVLAAVVHARPQGSNAWVVGCSLERPLSEEDVQALVS
jgi:hypothetical protein